jgi:transposase InsO family protein
MLEALPPDQKVSYGKGYGICRDNGLLLKKRKPRGITKADPSAMASEDHVRRNFRASRPGEKMLTDITEIQCKDGKLYLCCVLDCFHGAITGFSMSEHMKAALVQGALESAAMRWEPPKGCIIHSDRGSQFTSHSYRETLNKEGFQQSMGRTRSCADNARMESFFATLKKELIYRLKLYRFNREEVRGYIFEWIAYYNHRRRHTSNEGHMPPLVKYEFYMRNTCAA